MSDLKIFSKDIPIKGKRIIVRLDLNVPITNLIIDDDTRIKVVEPFINKLLENKAKVILLSHLGRPNGRDDKFSLKPVAKEMSNLLGEEIIFIDTIKNNEIKENLEKNPGRIFFIKHLK